MGPAGAPQRVSVNATRPAGASQLVPYVQNAKGPAGAPIYVQKSTSFAQTLASNASQVNAKFCPLPVPNISEKHIEVHRGEACITFEDNEVEQMNELENFLLVGKFSHGRPLLDTIRTHFAKTYMLKGTVEIGLMDARHVFLAFTNADDCVNILIKGQILFEGKNPMRLFRWTSEFDTRYETSLAPVWVLLPNLKANCFSIPCLKQIVKPIGKFLHVDAATAKFSRPNVAKVKVEIDLLKPLRHRLFIRLGSKRPGLEDNGFWQSVEYEKVPPYCTKCRKQGHYAVVCHTGTVGDLPPPRNSVQAPRNPRGMATGPPTDPTTSRTLDPGPSGSGPSRVREVALGQGCGSGPLANTPGTVLEAAPATGTKLTKNQRKRLNRKKRKAKGKAPLIDEHTDPPPTFGDGGYEIDPRDGQETDISDDGGRDGVPGDLSPIQEVSEGSLNPGSSSRIHLDTPHRAAFSPPSPYFHFGQVNLATPVSAEGAGGSGFDVCEGFVPEAPRGARDRIRSYSDGERAPGSSFRDAGFASDGASGKDYVSTSRGAGTHLLPFEPFMAASQDEEDPEGVTRSFSAPSV